MLYNFMLQRRRVKDTEIITRVINGHGLVMVLACEVAIIVVGAMMAVLVSVVVEEVVVG